MTEGPTSPALHAWWVVILLFCFFLFSCCASKSLIPSINPTCGVLFSAVTSAQKAHPRCSALARPNAPPWSLPKAINKTKKLGLIKPGTNRVFPGLLCCNSFHERLMRWLEVEGAILSVWFSHPFAYPHLPQIAPSSFYFGVDQLKGGDLSC